MLHAEATEEAKALRACGFSVNVQLSEIGTVWLWCMSRDDGMGQVCQESTIKVLVPRGQGRSLVVRGRFYRASMDIALLKSWTGYFASKFHICVMILLS